MSPAILEVSSDPPSTANRPKISLANQPSGTPDNQQPLEPQSTPQELIDKIPTFWIWSVFNLIFVPFGIACCYFSYKVSQLKLQNRYKLATKWSRRTFVLNIVTTLLMAAVIITVVMLRYDFKQLHTAAPVNETRTTSGFIAWQPGR